MCLWHKSADVCNIKRTSLVSTYKDSGGHGCDEDQLLHLGLGGEPLVVEPSHCGVAVVAGVVVPAGPVVRVEHSRSEIVIKTL